MEKRLANNAINSVVQKRSLALPVHADYVECQASQEVLQASWKQTNTALIAVKVAHTIAWAFFASCTVLLPFAAHANHFRLAALLISFILLETLTLLVNRWRCPLTGLAGRFTAERQANFDIYLTQWLAKYNKEIFGSLFVVGLAYTVIRWCQYAGGT